MIKDDNGVKTYVLRTIDSIRYQDHCDHHILTLDTDIQNIIDTVRTEAESTKDVLQDLRCLKSRMKGFWWSPSKPTATEKAKYCDEILDLVNKL